MANEKISSNWTRGVKIDTAPAAGGYWSDPVSLRKGVSSETLKSVIFSAQAEDAAVATEMTPTLQFKTSDGDWTDFNNDDTPFIVGDCKILEANAAFLQWRAGVKEGGYTSGSAIIGFNW